MGIIKTDKLSYQYKTIADDGSEGESVTALDGIDVEILKGQFVAILGHNGSGKSTLAKQINALIAPTGGTIWVGGMDTKDESHLWDIRQTAGMVFQNPDNQLIAPIVEDEVGFGPENMGVPAEEIWQRVEEALSAVGMLQARHESPNRLSGGQKQRIAIAGALAMKPQCIVFDEPTAMLDPIGREEVMRTARKLNEEGMTIILITHYMEEAAKADRVIVMDGGHIVMDGTPKEIFSRKEDLEAVRLTLPQVTQLAWELKQEGLDLPDGILTAEELVDELCRLN